MREQLQPAYVLHRRAFRDSSELVEVFSAEHGRLSLVARGMNRRRHGGSLGSLLQPFRPLLLSYTGKRELLTLTGAETGGDLALLRGRAMLSGLYLNELLLRLLHRFVAHHSLFLAYAAVLADLGGEGPIEPCLRQFEFAVLEELGYGVDLECEADSGNPLNENEEYLLLPERGFSALKAAGKDDRSTRFAGRDLLALAAGDFHAVDAQSAKRLVRLLLHPHIGDAPLRSRSMFAAYKGSKAGVLGE